MRNLNNTKTKPKPTLNCSRVHIIVHNCHTQHRTVLIIFSSYPPDNRHGSDAVCCWGGRGRRVENNDNFNASGRLGLSFWPDFSILSKPLWLS